MAEIAGGYGVTPQPLPSDVCLLGRAPPAGSPPGTEPLYFANPFSTLDAAIRFVVEIGAVGTSQLTAAASPGPGCIAVITVASQAPGGGVIGGVRLAAAPGTQRYLNRSSLTVLAYPPPGAVIEAQSANAPVSLAPGGSADFHSPDGNQFYAA